MELTGIDLNPDSIAIAKSQSESGIRWVAGDVFAYRAPRPAHLIVSSLFTHHLGDSDVVRFVRWMEQNAEMGWFINDLSRAAIPYYLFRWFAKAGEVASVCPARRSGFDCARLCARGMAAALCPGGVDARRIRGAQL